ncbi:hypothetical protein BH11PSE13_BH11PSE13_06090 [soil metagenome]
MPVRLAISIRLVPHLRRFAREAPPKWGNWTALIALMMMFACALPARASDGTRLSALLTLMRPELSASPLKRPMLLKSSDTASGLRGDVYAIVDQPLPVLAQAMGTPVQWCEAMLLHINNRKCTVAGGASGDEITLSVVRKYDQPVENAFHLPFAFKLVDKTTAHLEVRLGAVSGPLGTSNYRIVVEAVPADASHSFLHFSYAYEENFMAHTALQAYLATFGRSKVGFTVIGQTPAGEPDYIRGTYGLVERNAMRYFLAVDAHVNAGKDAESARNAWFSATERYPRQLHEIDRDAYLELKATDARH